IRAVESTPHPRIHNALNPSTFQCCIQRVRDTLRHCDDTDVPGAERLTGLVGKRLVSQCTGRPLAGRTGAAGGLRRGAPKSVRAGELEPPRGFNWLGLAEVAAFNARRDAARVARPLDRFPAEQQRVLRAALCSDQLDFAVTTPELRAWLAAALPALIWADT